LSSPPERIGATLRIAGGRPRARPVSPIDALGASFYDTVGLLLTPFDGWRWLKLSLVCLFLGGGTPTAAFNWTLGALPGEVSARSAIERARAYIGDHPWLVVLVILLGLAITVAGLYLRSLFRFVLVDTIVRHEVSVRSAWSELRPLGRSYFRWLVGLLLTAALALAATALAAFFYLRSATAGVSSLAFSIALVNILLLIALSGLVLMVVVTLTDDLVVPIMYADRLPLGAAWRKFAPHLRAEAGAFTVYVLLRFVVSLMAGVLVLLFLFPILFSVFSGVVIAVGVVVLALKMVGLTWVWNRATILVASGAALVLTGFLLVLLSVAGMPGQVLLQGFGMRFVSSRFPSVESLWLSPRRAGSITEP